MYDDEKALDLISGESFLESVNAFWITNRTYTKPNITIQYTLYVMI